MTPARSAIAAPSEAELIEVEAYMDNVEDGAEQRALKIHGPSSEGYSAGEHAKRLRNNRRLQVVATVRRLIELARERGAT